MKLSLIGGSIILALSRIVFAANSAQEDFPRGLGFFNAAEYVDAHAVFDQLKGGMKASGQFNYYYGLSLLKTDNSEQAITAMKRAIAIEPGNANYRYALGLAYASRMSELSLLRAAMMIGSAKEALVKAVELDPRHVGATKALVELLLDVPGVMGGDSRTAHDLIRKLWTLDPASAAAMEAKVAARSGNRAQTEELLLQAAKTPGSEAFIRLRLAKFYVDQQEYSKAIAYGQEYLAMPKHWSDFSIDTAYAHLWLAIAYHAVGDKVGFQSNIKAVEAANLPERIRKEVADSYDKAGIDH